MLCILPNPGNIYELFGWVLESKCDIPRPHPDPRRTGYQGQGSDIIKPTTKSNRASEESKRGVQVAVERYKFYLLPAYLHAGCARHRLESPTAYVFELNQSSTSSSRVPVRAVQSPRIQVQLRPLSPLPQISTTPGPSSFGLARLG
jgi:hypothetical protein